MPGRRAVSARAARSPLAYKLARSMRQVVNVTGGPSVEGLARGWRSRQRKRVRRLMREEKIQGQTAKRFKETTNGDHHDLIVANVPDRHFTEAAPNQQ